MAKVSRKGQRESVCEHLDLWNLHCRNCIFWAFARMSCRLYRRESNPFLILFFAVCTNYTCISMLYHNACLPLKDTMCFMYALCFVLSLARAVCASVCARCTYIREDILYLLYSLNRLCVSKWMNGLAQKLSQYCVRACVCVCLCERVLVF